jgi:hypothetical protein
MLVDEDLILAAADLARASPENWRKFLEGLGVRSEHMRNLLVNSPVGTLQEHQGHARELAHLLKMFQSCTQLADKLKGK